MYDCSVKVMARMLGQLAGILRKGAAHAQAVGFDESVLLNGRLAPDMFPLSRRVQVATDMAKGAAARLSGFEPPVYADDESTIETLLARIDKTLAYLDTFEPAQIDGSEDRPVVSKTRHGTFYFDSGRDYLMDYALPNFYFQMSTAYLILRHNGVSIGLDDFLGAQNDNPPESAAEARTA
jgi:hypothetical protein